MSGNKALIKDLALLRATIRVVDTCLGEGLPLPDVWRKLVADLAGLVRTMEKRKVETNGNS